MSRISRFKLLGLHTNGMRPSSSPLLPTEGMVDRLGRFSLLSPKAVLDTFSTQYLSQLPAANGTDETSWHSKMSYFTLLPSLPIWRIVFGSGPPIFFFKDFIFFLFLPKAPQYVVVYSSLWVLLVVACGTLPQRGLMSSAMSALRI